MSVLKIVQEQLQIYFGYDWDRRFNFTYISRNGLKILDSRHILISCCVFQEKVTVELIQVLDEEERRWAQTLHIEEYQSHLARSVIQVHCHFMFTVKQNCLKMTSL